MKSLCRCCGRTGSACICTYGPSKDVVTEGLEKWLIREMIEDGQATPEIKVFLQGFAKRRDLDLTRN